LALDLIELHAMKFAFLIFKYFPFGGMQRDMLRIASALAGKGHEVHVYAISWEGEPPPSGIHVHLLEARGLLNHKRYENFMRKAQAEVAAKDFDLLLGFNPAPGLDVYFAADSCFKERAHQERGVLYRLSGRYRWFAANEKAVFGPGSQCEILLLSPQEKADFQRWYATPDQRFHILPPYLSAERMVLRDKAQCRQALREELGIGGQDHVLLLVGSGFRTKGLDRAIHALAALPPALREQTHLLAVGQDNPKAYRQLANDLGLASRVHISAGRADIPQLMQGADLLVHPARRELAGHVLLEAMASGLPVLASDVCGYAFHVKQANAGRLLATPLESDELGRELVGMLTSSQRESWAANGLDYAHTIMAANGGSAEADILVRLAQHKAGKRSPYALAP
jgi:UDP-glucose:(heptosyl)LPS alpha-1,3-glucosyltransferase